MRIRGAHSTARQDFWSQTRRWLQSRQGLAQFLLATGVGFVLAMSLAAFYKLGGWELVNPMIAPLLTEARETVEEVRLTNDLPILYFDIGFRDFQALARQREEALERGILLHGDDDWRRAQIRVQGETIPVRVRLKGDWTDHLGENKWSFRVDTRGDATLMGMRSFSVQSPATREFLNEWLYLEELRRYGILAPRYTFVNVFVNGDNWGIYALEESFSKELLESQGRREGVIVRFDEDLQWRHRALTYDASLGELSFRLDPIAYTLGKLDFAQVDEFNTTRTRNDPILEEQSITAMGLLRGFQKHELSPAEVFDTDLMGQYLAHTSLWAAGHGVVWHNERYYYNPLTSQLEPIGYDAMPLAQGYLHFVDLAQYDDLSVMESYAQEVTRIAQPGYLEEFKATYLEEFERYQNILADEFPTYALEPPWEQLSERQRLLEASLHPPQTVHTYLGGNMPSTTVDLQVGNIVRYPVVLRQLKVGEQVVEMRPDWVLDSDWGLLEAGAKPEVVLRSADLALEYVSLQIPATVVNELLPADTTLYSNTLQLVTSLYGVEDEIIVDVQQYYPPMLSARVTPPRPSVEGALAQHPFLTATEEAGFLALKPGSWEVDGDLVLPDGFGLVATQSVTLTFDTGALFLANGPLLLGGSGEGRVYLGPKEDAWAGLIVLQAGPEAVSVLHNVEIRGTAGISREGWMTTGGVTFYESPVVLQHCRLLDSFAEDAINVMRTDFEFVDTEFGSTASDAFDGDFVQGRVENCAFHDVRGDGIDVSGSEVQIRDTNLLWIYDKGISVGEASQVTVEDVNVQNVAMAIASKDLSQVEAKRVHISRAWIAGLAAYQKKVEYGSATIEASDVVFEDSSPQSLVQTGSHIAMNGAEARTSNLDVDELYAHLEALAKMRRLDYRLGPAIGLVGHTVTSTEFHPGDELSFYLYWQAESQPDRDWTVFVHVLDASGQFITQWDVMPAEGEAPTSHWSPGEFVEDLHRIPLPPDMQPGEYHIVIGLYDWRTGERLPAYDQNGNKIPDAAIVLEQTFTVTS
jgi:hypothetical protein